jgi:hypothetical protein
LGLEVHVAREEVLALAARAPSPSTSRATIDAAGDARSSEEKTSGESPRGGGFAPNTAPNTAINSWSLNRHSCEL